MDGPPHLLEEIALSNMWGIAALVEVLERKGLLTRDEIRDALHALRNRHPEGPPVDRETADGSAKGGTDGRRVIRSLFSRV